MKRVERVAIAGAGLGGLAVAVALRRQGFSGPISIVDGKPAFADDRTWCWWNVPGVPFAERASYAWTAWRVEDGGAGGTATSSAHPYLHLRARDYYAACTELLARSDTRIAFGESVMDIVDDGCGAVLRTARGERRADLVIDARGLRPATRLRQHFAGMHVVTERPVFDTGAVTLMDFEPARDGMQFIYVLPFSAYDALVEHTVVDGGSPNAAARRLRVERYLRERYGVQRWTEVRGEAGVIPLGGAPLRVQPSPRVIRAGIAAGATRASSGYTYVRTHRHADAIAAHVVHGVPLRPAGSRRLELLDALMLAALEQRIVDVPRVLARLFAEAPGDAIARFMSDAPELRDEARVYAAVAAALPAAFLPRIASLARA